MLEEPKNHPDCQPQQIMTWAPMPSKIAQWGSVLRYENIIDGLCEQEKRVLRYKLKIQSSEKDRYAIDTVANWEGSFRDISTVPMIAFAGSDDCFLCCELC